MYLRFIRHLKSIEVLTLRNHMIHKLYLKQFLKQLLPIKTLRELDLRVKGEIQSKKLSRKEKELLLEKFPNLEKFNNQKLNEIKIEPKKTQKKTPFEISFNGKVFLNNHLKRNKCNKIKARKEDEKENRPLNIFD